MDHGVLAGRDIGGWGFEGLVCQPQRPGIAADIGRIAGDDAVKLIGVAGRLQQALTPTSRTAVPVGVAGITTVEGFDEELRFGGHLVFGPISEVDELLGMPHEEAGATAGVAVVSSAGGVTATERVSQFTVSNRAAPAAAADGKVLSVPAG